MVRQRSVLLGVCLLCAARGVQAQNIVFIDTPDIKRSNLNGSGSTTILTSFSPLPFSLSLDLVNRNMYWADLQTVLVSPGINRAGINGSNPVTIINDTNAFPDGIPLRSVQGVAVDYVRGKLYFTERDSSGLENNSGRLCRADLDGSDIEVLLSGAGVNPRGLAVDMAGARIYWADSGSGTIKGAGLDGSAIGTVVSGLVAPRAIALNLEAHEIYWIQRGPSLSVPEIRKVNLGTNVVSVVVPSSNLNVPVGLAVNYCDGKLYFSDGGLDLLFRRSLSGGPVEVLASAGNASSIAMDICADGNPCTDDDCQLAPSACMFQNNADACTDSDPCTTLEACSGGVCTGTQVDCSSFNDSCNSSGCNPATGQCETNPTNNGGACDDGNPCTAGETCQSGDCQGGSTVDCSLLDGACHVGVCNSGACESQPTNQGGACDDGNPCTTGETCNAGTCQAGSTLDCSSLNGACQVGVCNSGQCESQAANQGGACDDGNACTTGPTCNAGACGGGRRHLHAGRLQPPERLRLHGGRPHRPAESARGDGHVDEHPAGHRQQPRCQARYGHQGAGRCQYEQRASRGQRTQRLQEPRASPAGQQDHRCPGWAVDRRSRRHPGLPVAHGLL
jgi:hypothetical protein